MQGNQSETQWCAGDDDDDDDHDERLAACWTKREGNTTEAVTLARSQRTIKKNACTERDREASLARPNTKNKLGFHVVVGVAVVVVVFRSRCETRVWASYRFLG